MRDVSVPVIEAPERFFPEPVLVRAPTTRPLPDGFAEFFLEKKGEWERIHPICVAVLDGLAKGLRFEEIAAAIPDQTGFRRPQLRAVARLYLWKLAKLGHIRLDLEPTPEVFAEKYRHVKELGRGGLGVAHLCEEIATGRKVVVKHAWGVIQDVNRGQKALANEAQVMRSFDHPALPRLHDTFTIRGLLHVVRDFGPGRDLFATYKGRPPPPEKRLDLARQVAEALQHVHERGHIFFDARPANYVEDEKGQVMVIDLGAMAPHEGGRSRVRGSRGSPGYTAPELLVGGAGGWREATLRTDVFAFGRLLYFLARGENPGRRWRYAELSDDLASRGSIPEAERALIDACCRDDPSERPEDMRAVLGRLT